MHRLMSNRVNVLTWSSAVTQSGFTSQNAEIDGDGLGNPVFSLPTSQGWHTQTK
jgi:hypothetical protein